MGILLEYFHRITRRTKNFFLDKDAANIHYIPIPSEWQDYKINNASLPSKGYAMYRLRVLMPKTDIPLSFAMTDICMSYRLYVNEYYIIQTAR